MIHNSVVQNPKFLKVYAEVPNIQMYCVTGVLDVIGPERNNSSIGSLHNLFPY